MTQTLVSRLREPRALAAIGLILAASAAAITRQSRRAEAAHPPLGQFAEIDGVKLHYIDRGAGEPLVLLHGNGTFAEDFGVSGLIDRAAAHYRVIAIDRPGFGYSERPRGTLWTAHAQARLVRRLLHRLRVEWPLVLGHSWGTHVAVALALGYPADVRSLVLVSGYYFPTLRLDVPLFSGPAIPVLGDLLRWTVSPWVGLALWPALMKIVFGPASVPAHFSAFPRWMALRPSQLRAAAEESALLVPGAFTLARRYRQLKVPATIVAGAGDRFVGARHSMRLHSRLAHSDLRLVPGAGHMVHQVAPDEILDAIERARLAAPGVPAAPE